MFPFLSFIQAHKDLETDSNWFIVYKYISIHYFLKIMNLYQRCIVWAMWLFLKRKLKFYPCMHMLRSKGMIIEVILVGSGTTPRGSKRFKTLKYPFSNNKLDWRKECLMKIFVGELGWCIFKGRTQKKNEKSARALQWIVVSDIYDQARDKIQKLWRSYMKQ